MSLRENDACFRHWKGLVNERVLTHVPEPVDNNQLVRGAMRYAVVGGHRWRPILLMASYNLTGKDVSDVLDAACAVEVIHACTLMLDDLPSVDNSPLRRGVPSCHSVYGEAVTVYASHLLYALAERLCCDNALSLGVGEKSLRAHLAELRERLIEAQVIEINLARGAVPADESALGDFYKFKGSPFVSAAWLAAILGDADDPTRARLTEYASHLGVAYQLADDIADVEGDASRIGKPVGMDRGKINLVTLLGVERSRELARASLSKAGASLDLMAGDTSVLRNLARRIVGPDVSLGEA
jgi:geranylgeranyl pyrophosphate synthase